MAGPKLEPIPIDPKNINFKFSIIHFHGSRDEAETGEGRKVYRQKKIFVPEWNRYVVCAAYDVHFIFENKQRGYVAYQCTCGSLGVIVGSNAYKQDASPTETGELFVCLEHAQSGRHMDGAR